MGAKFSAPVQTGPGAHTASCTMGTVSIPEVKSGRGVTLTPHPLLVSWSWKGRAIPLLPLWAVRPVQSLSACTRVTFNFLYTKIYDATTQNTVILESSQSVLLKLNNMKTYRMFRRNNLCKLNFCKTWRSQFDVILPTNQLSD